MKKYIMLSDINLAEIKFGPGSVWTESVKSVVEGSDWRDHDAGRGSARAKFLFNSFERFCEGKSRNPINDQEFIPAQIQEIRFLKNEYSKQATTLYSDEVQKLLAAIEGAKNVGVITTLGVLLRFVAAKYASVDPEDIWPELSEAFTLVRKGGAA